MTTDHARHDVDEREQALIESYGRRANWRRGRYAAKFAFDGYLVTPFREPLDPLRGYNAGAAWGWDICRDTGAPPNGCEPRLARSDGLWAASVDAEADALGALIALIRSGGAPESRVERAIRKCREATASLGVEEWSQVIGVLCIEGQLA